MSGLHRLEWWVANWNYWLLLPSGTRKVHQNSRQDGRCLTEIRTQKISRYRRSEISWYRDRKLWLCELGVTWGTGRYFETWEEEFEYLVLTLHQINMRGVAVDFINLRNPAAFHVLPLLTFVQNSKPRPPEYITAMPAYCLSVVLQFWTFKSQCR